MCVNSAGWLCNSPLSHFGFSAISLPKGTQIGPICRRLEVVTHLVCACPMSSTSLWNSSEYKCWAAFLPLICLIKTYYALGILYSVSLCYNMLVTGNLFVVY